MSERADEDPPIGGADPALMSLIDRLGLLLERSELAELEVQAGGAAIILGKPQPAVPSDGATAAAVAPPGASPAHRRAGPADQPAEAPAMHAVLAPLTGLFYASPTPDSPPYVTVGSEIVVGQVIGLIEAMKLFNEIKSDVAGRVVRMAAETGRLVKAKQPLIEVEPL